jgi:hypothetical protein
MQIIAPDILAGAVGLSPVLCGLGVLLGLMLWMFGWRAHRFWIVLLATVLAGVYGLSRAPEYGSQPFLAGVLFAIAAGLLALALVRVIAFIAGGIAASLLVQALFPSWHDPLVSFLVGGLTGLILFRVWTMALTSLAGTVVMSYSGLCLADGLGKLQAVTWAEKQTLLLDWACGGLTLLGVLVQFTGERRRARRQKQAELAAQKKKKEPPPPPPREEPKGWSAWAGKILKRAG